MKCQRRNCRNIAEFTWQVVEDTTGNEYDVYICTVHFQEELLKEEIVNEGMESR